MESGRGFYGYSTGGAAPFIKVEYYDPKSKWMVKKVLESGQILPIGGSSNPKSSLPNPFDIYEGHIPYIIQVFKDLRISGANFVDVAMGVFRPTLPKKKEDATKEEDDRVFNRSNTQPELLWTAEGNPGLDLDFETVTTTTTTTSEAEAEDDSTLSQNQTSELAQILGIKEVKAAEVKETESMAKLQPPWTKRMSLRSHIEIDTHVTEIINREVDELHQSNVNSQSKSKKIYWRAIPSLREIWEEERARCAEFLPPDKAFLTPEEEAQFNDNATPTTNSQATAKSAGASQLTESTLVADLTDEHVVDGNTLGGMRSVKSLKHLYKHFMHDQGNLQKRLYSAGLGLIPKHEGDLEAADEILKNPSKNKKSLFAEEKEEEEDDDDNDLLGKLGEMQESGNESSSSMPAFMLSQTQSDCEGDETQSQSQSQSTLTFSTTLPRSLETQYEHDTSSTFQKGRSAATSSKIRHDAQVVFSQQVNRGGNKSKFNELEFKNGLEKTQLTQQQHLTQQFTNRQPSQFTQRTQHTQHTQHTQYPEVESDTESEGSEDLSDDEKTFFLERYEALEQTQTQNHFLNPTNSTNPITAILAAADAAAAEINADKEAQILLNLESQLHTDQNQNLDTIDETKSDSTFSRQLTYEDDASNTIIDSNGNYDLTLMTRLTPFSISSSSPDSPVKQSSSQNLSMSLSASSNPNSDLGEHHQLNFLSEATRTKCVSIELTSKPPTRIEVLTSLRATATATTSPTSQSNNFSSQPMSLTGQDLAQPIKPPITEMIGQQGGRAHFQGAGSIKTKQNATNMKLKVMTILSVEVHVQCRIAKSPIDQREMAMTPQSKKDKVQAISYVFGKDPGGGEELQVMSEGSLYIPVSGLKPPTPPTPLEKKLSMGYACENTHLEQISDEKSLLRRFASLVQVMDPDMMVSWNPQDSGIGYLIERGREITITSSTNGCSKNKEIIDMIRLLGRTPNVIDSKTGFMENDWAERVGAGADCSRVVGRVMLNGMQIFGEEVKHPNASYQPAIVELVMEKRMPDFDSKTLAHWYGGKSAANRRRVLDFKMLQCKTTLELLDKMDIIGRAGEAARLSNVEFDKSLPGIRGSQYRVEGILARSLESLYSVDYGSAEPTALNSSTFTSDSNTASPWKRLKTNNDAGNGNGNGNADADTDTDAQPKSSINSKYMFLSPSEDVKDTADSLEVAPLVLEPQSGFYTDPVVVCDFTALYPSLVIGYNLCYSTIAGVIPYESSFTNAEAATKGKIGCMKYNEVRSASVVRNFISRRTKRMDEDMTTKTSSNDGEECMEEEEEDDDERQRAIITPSGAIFVQEPVLKGVLPQVLDEILATRAMLKRAKKAYKAHGGGRVPSGVYRQLEARQLALKLIANVTYGYTSATFSGRCCCPPVADAIVSLARISLEGAISIANKWGEKGKKWEGAEVVYGDTDSLFVRMKGYNVKEAFKFGKELCKAVTDMSPPPVSLKLEKVYETCILQTKKKYVGMMYESPDQPKPTFEDKGIETVRRDQCLLTKEILKGALLNLFSTKGNMSSLRHYLNMQWTRVLRGQLPLKYYVLTGRVRTHYKKNLNVQAVLAKKMMDEDPGFNMKNRERLPYVIVAMPGRNYQLKDGVKTPMEVLESWGMYNIHTMHYINRHVNPALIRCLSLSGVGANVEDWFRNCPKPRQRVHFWPEDQFVEKNLMSFFGADVCSLCGKQGKAKDNSKAMVCEVCKGEANAQRSGLIALDKYNSAVGKSNELGKICSSCNNCVEDCNTFGVAKKKKTEGGIEGGQKKGGRKNKDGIVRPIANCININCDVFFRRHMQREKVIEAEILLKQLELNPDITNVFKVMI